MINKKCKKCGVFKSGEMSYKNYSTRKVGSFIDTDGGVWYGLICGPCYLPQKSEEFKKYKIKVKEGQVKKIMQKPLLGPRTRPMPKLRSCQSCGNNTRNYFNCWHCLNRLSPYHEINDFYEAHLG